MPRDALLSSPDPLNDSPIFSSPAKPRYSTRPRSSLPLEGSSPRKQVFQLDVGDRISPQKIRVTVETEHSQKENDYEQFDSNNALSPTPFRPLVMRRNEKTTITTIPVKGLTDSEDDTLNPHMQKSQKGRGRPRKSISTPVPSKSRTRIVTLANKSAGRRTLGDLVDGDAENDWEFAMGAGVEVSRGKGRSRSKKATPRNKATRNTKHPDSSSTTSKKVRGRRRTLSPEEVLILEDGVGDIPPVELGDIGQDNHEDRGVLVQAEVKIIPAPSTFSTIKSATTISDDTPDILLATFSHANPTPIRAGWSSPRIVSGSISDDLDMAKNKPSLLAMSQGIEGQWNSVRYEDEAEDEAGELQEFDTILESEGFSMISVESVPSLRQHFSSPMNKEQRNEQKEEEINVGQKDTFFNVEPEILKTATPSGITMNPNLLFANGNGNGDSFSSVPPEILDAATPGRSLKDTKLFSTGLNDRWRTEESLPRIDADTWEAAIPGKKIGNKALLSVQANHLGVNNDSFSSIPSTILEAATPAAKDCEVSERHLRIEGNSTAIESLLIVPTEPVAGSTNQNHSSSRLLTPDDTPSPRGTLQPHGNEPSHKLDAKVPRPRPCKEPSEGSSITYPHVKSSPPFVAPKRYTYTAHLRQHRMRHLDVTETPSIVFSSPSLPPPMQRVPPKQTQVSAKELHGHSKPALSPIVRAGRALQDITVPSSSRSNAQSLRSPFKSPSSQRNSGGSGEAQDQKNQSEKSDKSIEHKGKRIEDDIFGGFSDDTRRELRRNLTGEELSRSHQINAQSKLNALVSQDDPFNSGRRNMRTDALDGQSGYILELPSQNLIVYPELHDGLVNNNDITHSDGAMSWLPKDIISVKDCTDTAGRTEEHIDEDFHQDIGHSRLRESEWMRERISVIQQIESASESQVIVLSSDNDPPYKVPREDEDEEDIWQAEARHSSSLQSEHERDKPKERLAGRQRSKIPSPWRKNSKHFVYSNELSRSSSPPSFGKSSAISQKAPAKPELIEAPINVGKLPFQSITDNEDELEPSIVWHIPQKSNFTPQYRAAGNLDLSALLASSPIKGPQGLYEVSALRAPLLATLSNKAFGETTLEGHSPKESDLASATPLTKQAGSGGSWATQDSAQDSAIDYSTSSNRTHETDSELPSEGPQTKTETSIHYPHLQTAYLSSTSVSPAKSSLRDPSMVSLNKSVAYISAPTAETIEPSQTPLLSGETWSKAHWQLLSSFYQDSKVESPDSTKNSKAGERSKYLGKKAVAQGTSLVLRQWHLDIVARFRHDARVAPGWNEGVVAKRLFAIIVGEERRAKGEI